MYPANGYSFATKDADNDVFEGNCAVRHGGGWWYKACGDANLNGLYYNSSINYQNGTFWKTWKNNHESLKQTKMKIKLI